MDLVVRQCIFCGGPANSKEDAIPRWMAANYQSPAFMDLQLGEGNKVITYAVNQPEILIKKVCETCNNGWMSRLESRSKPVIERLWRERSCELDIHDCRTLALWSCKTAMMFEASRPQDQWAFTDLDRCLLYTNDRMPKSVEVWIVKCQGFTALRGGGEDNDEPGQPGAGRNHHYVLQSPGHPG